MNNMFGDIAAPSFSHTAAFKRSSTVRIESLLIQKISGYNDQVLRPFVTNSNLTGSELTAVATSIVDKAQQGSIDTATIASIGNSFLTRSSEPIASAPIVNGWNQTRARFMMKVILTSPIGTTNPLFILGYTNYDGLTTNNLDPNMEFYVNNIVKGRNQVYQTAFGNQNNLQQVGTQQIFTNNSGQKPSSPFGNYSNNGDTLVMSPMHIYQAIGTAGIYNNESGYPNSILDNRFKTTPGGVSAPKKINVAPTYVATVLNSYISGSESEEFDSLSIDSAIRHYVNSHPFESTSLEENDFFAALDAIRHNSIYSQNKFTLSELQRLDPNVNNVITQIAPDNEHTYICNNSNHWIGTDMNTVSASMVASSVPSLMTEQMISFIRFKSTNHTVDGRPQTTILFGGGFAQCDMQLNYERFKAAFELFVVNDITYGNSIGYMVDVSCHLDGQTTINIKMDNLPETLFSYPTFADALISPVLTTDKNHIFNVANDFGNLVDYVKTERYSSTNPLPTVAF